MHGIIHAELKKYVETRKGPAGWSAALDKAGLGRPGQRDPDTYKDVEAAALIQASASLTGVPPLEILEDFGEFIKPALLDRYRSLIDPSRRKSR